MDPVSSARSARESLARGLAALQSPGLPPQLMIVADPVAQAMGALHRIEATGGAAIPEAAPAALAFVRHALGLLQSQGIQHPAVDQSMEAIAVSLGVVHQLSLLGAPAVAPAQAVSAYAGTMMMDQGQLNPPTGAQRPQVPPAQQPAWQPPAQQPAAAQPQWQPPPPPPPIRQQPAAAQPPAWQPSPAAAPPAQQPAAPAWQASPAPPPPPAHARPAAAQPLAAVGAHRIEADLGAHSPTNFYKGLAGNDVVDSGGLFIATYQLPSIGTQLVIHVSLPGGYEFDSLAVVRWTREAPQSTRGEEAPPGFGAQFVQISPEARQLVYRYVRNREPLFYDDL